MLLAGHDTPPHVGIRALLPNLPSQSRSGSCGTLVLELVASLLDGQCTLLLRIWEQGASVLSSLSSYEPISSSFRLVMPGPSV